MISSKKNKSKSKSKSSGKKRNWFWYLLLIVNLFILFPLIISYFAPYISPEKNTVIAFFGLVYPLFFLLNVGIIFMWMLRRSWMFLLSFIFLLIGYQHINGLIQFKFEANTQSGNEIKIVSYNVRLFDIYNWSGKGKDVAREEIFEFIKKSDASIVCFQEFYDGNKAPTPILSTFLESQKATNYYIDLINTSKSKTRFGLATFSIYPIINKQKIMFSNSNSNFGIYTDLLIDHDTIRVFNVHLESLHFDKHDYALVSGNTPEETEIKAGSKRIFGKIRRAFQKRASQAEELDEYINQSPFPVIVCGDFNDTPSSYVYNLLTNHLHDAFIESGNGFQFTYAGLIPLLRIDYILHDHGFNSSGSKVHKINCSDHFPISCSLYMKTN